MVLETAQLLSTVAAELGGPAAGLYKPTHRNHPCVQALVAHTGYREWVVLHGCALAAEYTYRFGREHKSERVIFTAALRFSTRAPCRNFFSQVMPEEFRQEDPHAAYRAYLVAKYAAWKRPPRWTRREPPSWWNALEATEVVKVVRGVS